MQFCRFALQQTVELNNAVLACEFSILTKILARKNCAIRCFYFTSILCLEGTKLVRYVRLIEFGDICGLGKVILEKLTRNTEIIKVEDYQYTKDTAFALRRTRVTRNQTNDAQVCCNMWKSMCDISQKHDNLGFISILILEGSDRKRHCYCMNLNPDVIKECTSLVIESPRTFNLSISFLIGSSLTSKQDLTFQDHLLLLNCMEPQFVHFPFEQGSNSWPNLSMKQGILSNCLDEVLRSQLRISSIQSNNAICGDSSPFHRLGGNSKIRSVRPKLLESLKEQFISKGFLRLAQRDQRLLSVIWNSYNPCTGLISFFPKKKKKTSRKNLKQTIYLLTFFILDSFDTQGF